MDVSPELSKIVYKTGPPKIPWKLLLENWIRFKYEVKDTLKTVSPNLDEYSKGWAQGQHTDLILYYFRYEADLEHWYVINDRAHGGKSWSELALGRNNMTGVFRGFQNQKIPQKLLPSVTGKECDNPYYKGFSYMQTKPFMHGYDKESFINVENFNAWKIRFRGDGRMYQFQLHVDLGLDIYRMYTFPIYTRGGPLWEEIIIPFSKMYSKRHDGMVLQQDYIDEYSVRYVRFLLNDGINGPFQLELDYIALYKHKPENVFNKKSQYYNPWRKVIKMTGTI